MATTMLALRVEFLTGVYMATKHNDPERASPEWPPHPDRLYSALVAAAGRLAENGSEDLTVDTIEALHWLQDIGAPQIWCSSARCRDAPLVAMPENPHIEEVWTHPRGTDHQREPTRQARILQRLLPAYRKPATLPIPAVVPDEPDVWFVWPNADPGVHLGTLRNISARVPYLGRSRSLVRITVEERAPQPNYVPDPSGDQVLRVPGPRRLEYLREKYRRDGGKPEPSPELRYRAVDDIGEPDKLPTMSVPSDAWILQLSPRDVSLPVTAAVPVSESLRSAVLERVHRESCGCDMWRGRLPHWHEAVECYRTIPVVLSGREMDGRRTANPHVAFLPLPFVNARQRHADGTFKGIAVLLPPSIEPRAKRLLARALSGITNEGLRIPGIGTWHLSEVPAETSPLHTLDWSAWTKPAAVWATATPVAFDHYPKGADDELRVLLAGLRTTGFDPHLVAEVSIGTHSPLHGTQPCQAYYERSGRARSWLRHVVFRFDRPVRGPVLLGRLRYFGLGLFYPGGDDQWGDWFPETSPHSSTRYTVTGRSSGSVG